MAITPWFLTVDAAFQPHTSTWLPSILHGSHFQCCHTIWNSKYFEPLALPAAERDNFWQRNDGCECVVPRRVKYIAAASCFTPCDHIWEGLLTPMSWLLDIWLQDIFVHNSLVDEHFPKLLLTPGPRGEFWPWLADVQHIRLLFFFTFWYKKCVMNKWNDGVLNELLDV